MARQQSTRRRKSNEHDEVDHNNERWLLTYSDLITLLMIFFVIMYAMSHTNIAKFQSLRISLSSAMHTQTPVDNQGVSGGTSILPSISASSNSQNKANKSISQTVKRLDQQQLDNLYRMLKTYVNSHDLYKYINVNNTLRGVQVTLNDVVLFHTGQAVLTPHAQNVLDGLNPFFKRVPNPIIVEGYTDNTPIHTAQFPSNWELSTARAVNVVHYLINGGVTPNRLSAMGYGQYHPKVPNTTIQNKQENRRINILILKNNSYGFSG